MSLWTRLRGTVDTLWQIGLGGPLIKNNSSVLEARNAADNAFIIMRGLDPVGDTDFATKFYADVTGLIKCRVATTANITLSGTQTIDGVAVVAGDRVFARVQTSALTRGVYIVAAGAWSRAPEFSTSAQANNDPLIYVRAGTANGNTFWALSTQPTIVLDTTALTFIQVDLDTTAPSNVTKATAAVGTSNYLARIDHKHDITTAAAVAVTTANAEGSSTSLSRADHGHDASHLASQVYVAFTEYQINGGTAVTGNFSPNFTTNGMKQMVVLGASVSISSLTFPGAGNYILRIVQDSTGSRVLTWSAAVQAPGGKSAGLVLSTAANSVDIAAIYYDGSTARVVLSKGFLT